MTSTSRCTYNKKISHCVIIVWKSLFPRHEPRHGVHEGAGVSPYVGRKPIIQTTRLLRAGLCRACVGTASNTFIGIRNSYLTVAFKMFCQNHAAVGVAKQKPFCYIRNQYYSTRIQETWTFYHRNSNRLHSPPTTRVLRSVTSGLSGSSSRARPKSISLARQPLSLTDTMMLFAEIPK